jgi:site-specific recombinase XerD
LPRRCGTPHRSADEYLLYPKNNRTRPMDPSRVHRWLKQRLGRAGLATSIQTHQLRHTAAQALYDLTGDLMLSQQLLRHEDIRTTRGYLRGSQERLRAAQAELEESWK